MTPLEFIAAATEQATDSDHVWPEYAACEAALESGFGASQLAREANNLFGMKQHLHPDYGTMTLPTREYLSGNWVIERDDFVRYPSWQACFADRMDTLRRLAPHYPHYAAALAAPNGEVFVREVSRTWSTDPGRANKVLRIWAKYFAPSEVTVDG